MKQLFEEGLGKMQAGDIDERMSRRPIERYQWPLGTALLIFSAAFLMRERRRERAAARTPATRPALAAAAMVFLLCATSSFAAAPGLDAYRNDKYREAYEQFEKTLKENPGTHATDKIEFDAGAAAYKMGDYGKALEWFSRSLLSKDQSLQQKSQYNIGRTLEERADRAQDNDKALGDLTNALSHYEEAVRLDPNDERAKANLEEVKKKIERLKQKPKDSPTPPPPQKDKKQDKKDQQQKNQQQKQDQQQQQQAKNNKPPPKPGESPSPSPGEDQQAKQQPGSSPTPSDEDKDKGEGKNEQDAPPSPSPSDQGSPTPSPSAGPGESPEAEGSPSASPSASPGKPKSGKVEASGDEKPKDPPNAQASVQAEAMNEGPMNEKQAQDLLKSMKDEEERVQLDERKVVRRVYKDW